MGQFTLGLKGCSLCHDPPLLAAMTLCPMHQQKSTAVASGGGPNCPRPLSLNPLLSSPARLDPWPGLIFGAWSVQKRMIRVEKDSWNWSTCSMSKVKSQKAHGLLWDSMGQKLGAWVNTKTADSKKMFIPLKQSHFLLESLSQYLSAGAQNFTSLPVEEAFRVPPRTKVPALEFAPPWLFVAAVHHSPRYFSDNITKWRKGQNSSGHYWAKNHLKIFSSPYYWDLLRSAVCSSVAGSGHQLLQGFETSTWSPSENAAPIGEAASACHGFLGEFAECGVFPVGVLYLVAPLIVSPS